MKTTLTQAWEAKGISGIALRQSVAYKLGGRFWKENPDKDKASTRGLWALTGFVILLPITFVVLSQMVKYASAHPSWLLYGAVFLVTFTLALLVGTTLVYGIRWMVSSTGVNRYVFQHRDDEVEL